MGPIGWGGDGGDVGWDKIIQMIQVKHICEYGSIVWCGDSGGVGFTVCVCVKEGQ